MIVLNHKMNLTNEEILNYIIKLKDYKDKFIVMPSALYVKDFVNNGFTTGIQNIYFENNGMYTGEISPMQAFSVGIEYALIGHFERRTIFNESDEIINKKVKSALKNNLKVILCVGDNLNENSQEVLFKQIKSGLKDVTEEVIIAYEPVYAIGTGKTPSIEDIERKIAYIKSIINAKVLYGGSISSNNIKELKKINNLDGYLIGSSSLDVNEVLKILEVVG